MRHRVKLTESDLHKIVKESVKRVLRESYDMTTSWQTDLASAADEMRYWNFTEEADLVEDYLDNNGGKTCDMGVLNAIHDVYKVALEKYKSGEARNWDDFDDFIKTLEDAMKSYTDYCRTAKN